MPQQLATPNPRFEAGRLHVGRDIQYPSSLPTQGSALPSVWADRYSMSDVHSDDEGELGLFAEPEGYYQPEKQPTFASHAMQDGRELTLRMVGHNPLWVRLSSFAFSSSCLGAIKVSIASSRLTCSCRPTGSSPLERGPHAGDLPGKQCRLSHSWQDCPRARCGRRSPQSSQRYPRSKARRCHRLP